MLRWEKVVLHLADGASIRAGTLTVEQPLMLATLGALTERHLLTEPDAEGMVHLSKTGWEYYLKMPKVTG